MRFIIVPISGGFPEETDAVFLETNLWDDYTYKTLYNLRYRAPDGGLRDVGAVKIGQFDMGSATGRPILPAQFTELEDNFFSLGQDDTYYEALNKLGEQVRDTILHSLNDIALNLDLFDRALPELVTRKSLLRNVSIPTVQNQFHRMALGGARLSPFSFTYIYPQSDDIGSILPLHLHFEVKPESQPPSNVHVIIGRNGVGKSHLLNHIANILVDAPNDSSRGRIYSPERFANLVSVAFSAFDDFEPISNPQDRVVQRLQYAYIGLKKIARAGEDSNSPKSNRALATEFGLSVKSCLQGPRLTRWRRALKMLESDPIFSDVSVADLADSAHHDDDETLRSNARELFRSLSSGHKIVLLTITRLVETVEEKSLVLLDEPESHLHPPLLSAFVRALSDLLINRNGVAIIATHSPVILQEVPRTCVWKLRRSGNEVRADRPQLETFGENVGTLTQEVFGLEVTNSGFHRMLAEVVNQGASYHSALEAFGGSLGGEARALIQVLLAERDRGRAL